MLGLKLTVVPLGAPVADRLMALLKPPLTVLVIVEVPWLPGNTLTEVGEPVSVKLGAAVTVTTRLTLLVMLVCPLLPVMVSGYVPAGVDELVLMLKLLEPEALKLEGLNAPVAPLGSPLTLKLTLPVNPLAVVSATV